MDCESHISSFLSQCCELKLSAVKTFPNERIYSRCSLEVSSIKRPGAKVMKLYEFFYEFFYTSVL